MSLADNAPRPPVRSSSNNAGGYSLATIAAVVCAGLLLLLLASTIVLALIPLYLPTKQISPVSSSRKYLILNPSSTISGLGATSTSACSAIAKSLNSAAGVTSGTVTPASCTFASQTGRKRRNFMLGNRRRRQSFVVRLFMIIDLSLLLCPRCNFVTYVNQFIGLTFTSTFEYFGTQTITFTILSISGDNNFGSLSTDTTTTSTTSTTTASTTASATTMPISG